MDNTKLLLGIVETVLGKSRHTSKHNYAFSCPFCHHTKPKLEVDMQTTADSKNPWNCWVCGMKGRTLVGLFRKLGASGEKVAELKPYVKYIPLEKSEEAIKVPVTLPKEFKHLIDSTNKSKVHREVEKYLTSRGITQADILKYGIGYCESGLYANSVIIQSYDRDGKLNYFISRSIEKDPFRKYNAPKCDKNEIIGLEYYINWKCPIVLCEGLFDAIAIRRNAIPLFGKTISTALMLQLVQSEVREIYIALDKDALSAALKHAHKLLDLGKEVYLVELDGKDPSSIGFEVMTEYLRNATQLTYSELLYKKLELC